MFMYDLCVATASIALLKSLRMLWLNLYTSHYHRCIAIHTHIHVMQAFFCSTELLLIGKVHMHKRINQWLSVYVAYNVARYNYFVCA